VPGTVKNSGFSWRLFLSFSFGSIARKVVELKSGCERTCDQAQIQPPFFVFLFSYFVPMGIQAIV